MSILSGWLKTRAYRKTTDGYKKESRDTSSETVFMNDGNTAETNLGAIQGITDSLTATSSNIALSVKAGNNLQEQIDDVNSNLSGKQSTITGAATTITSSNLTASRALESSSSGKVSISNTTAIELGYVSGVTSPIQTQLNYIYTELDGFKNVGGHFSQFVVLPRSYNNNVEGYGFCIRCGESSMNSYVNDTYWLSIDSSGVLQVGVQINGAKFPTWYTK